jgi:hypothetical protein
MATDDSNVASINRPERSSISHAAEAALSERQRTIDQVLAVAELLRANLAAASSGNDVIDDTHLEAALALIVEKLRTVTDLADSIALENAGVEILGGRRILEEPANA